MPKWLVQFWSESVKSANEKLLLWSINTSMVILFILMAYLNISLLPIIAHYDQHVHETSRVRHDIGPNKGRIKF